MFELAVHFVLFEIFQLGFGYNLAAECIGYKVVNRNRCGAAVDLCLHPDAFQVDSRYAISKIVSFHKSADRVVV